LLFLFESFHIVSTNNLFSMSLRSIFISTALLFSICAIAQTKTIPFNANNPEGATLTYYPPNPEADPTGTSVVICSSNSDNNAMIAALTKTGSAAFVLKNPQAAITQEDVIKTFEYLQDNARDYKIDGNKTGILTFGTAKNLTARLGSIAFIGMVDPETFPKIGASTAASIYIDASNKNSKQVLNFYNKWLKMGGKAELNLRQHPVNDSIKSQNIINWMSTLGLMKPLSNEKTEAQKSKENWANFSKYIEDRIHNDWAWLKRFEGDNEKVPAPAVGEKRVIFMGNSITQEWINTDPDFFKSNNYINRGIGGQTTPQMLVRFREDVINLQPKVVVILAGINDIAENTGPSKIENVAGNIFSMAELSKVNDIKVIICSVLPAFSFPWHPGIKPAESILKLNSMLKSYAEKNKLAYVDYYSAVVDENQGMIKELAKDGVHPNLAGYKIMEPLVKAAIDKTLAK